MKYLKLSFVLTVLLLVLSFNMAFAEEVGVKNGLAGLNEQKVILSEPVKSGVYYISFDMLAEDASANVYCRLLGNDGQFSVANYENLFDAAAFRNWTMYSSNGAEPVFTVYSDMYCDWNMSLPAHSKVSYSEKEWYEVDIWLDFRKRISTVYLNGKYFDTCKMNENLTALHGFSFFCENTPDTAKTYFKYRNLKHGYFSSNYITEEIENVHIPQYLKDSVDIEIITGKVGNIYFTPENISFDVGLKNKTKEAKSYDISYEVLNSGKTLWQSSETVDIKAGRSGARSVTLNLFDTDTQYGFFTIKVSLTDISTGEVFEKETRFSVSKKSDKVNEKMGLNHHHSTRRYEQNMADALTLFYNAGFGADRDGLVWSNYEISDGEYVLSDKLDIWLDMADEKSVKAVAILGYQNDRYKHLYPEGEVAAPPVDGEYMEKYKLYVENMVRDTIDRVGYYEVWNEWNLSYNNNGKEHYTYHPAEDYFKLVKTTYEIVDKINKEKGTNAKVLAGALGYNSGNGTDAFIEECLDLGIGNYCDGISCHPYWAHENPENNNYYSSLVAVRTIREMLDNRNLNHIEIVATELGYMTRDNGDVDEIDQAKWMVRSSAYYEGEIDLITWYLGQEKIDNRESENSFGIIKPWTGVEIPFEAKPAYIALANYNSLLAGGELVSRSPKVDDRYADGSYISNEQYTYHFKNNGKDIYMLVTMSLNGGELKLETGKAGIAELIDMYGNSSFIESDANGVYRISVANDEPLYIVPVAQNIEQTKGDEALSIYGYSDGYVFRDDGEEYITLQNGKMTEYKVDLSETPVDEGIVDVSFRFWPNMSPASYEATNQAVQTFEFGDGFSFNAQWKPHGASVWMVGGHFDFGSSGTRYWNTEKLGGVSEAGWFRQKDQNASAPHVYFDISAKINLNTKKIYLTIVENLETTSQTKTRDILRDDPFDYNADSFDFYRAGFLTRNSSTNEAVTDTGLQSLNSSLLIQSDGETSGDTVTESVVYTYPDGYIFKAESDDYLKLEKTMDSFADLKGAPVSEGIVDVSYRFWPNMVSYDSVSRQATQTFELGSGFSFNAQWSSWGDAYWLKDGKFNIGGQTIMMNKDGWNTNETAGLFRPKGQNATAPIAYYDISAKINLDTNKIYLTIVEHLETTTETKITCILENAEYEYNKDVFDYYKAGLYTTDECLQSLNSKLLIKADGNVAYRYGTTELSDKTKVIIKSGDREITALSEFNEADDISVNAVFENVTDDGMNTVLVIGYYQNDVLIKLDKIKNIHIDGGYENVRYVYNVKKENVEADSVKMYLWNGMTGMIPVKDAAWLK